MLFTGQRSFLKLFHKKDKMAAQLEGPSISFDQITDCEVITKEDSLFLDRLHQTAEKGQAKRPPTPRFTHASDQNAPVHQNQENFDRHEVRSRTESQSTSAVVRQWERNMLGSTASSTRSRNLSQFSEGSREDTASSHESRSAIVMLDVASSSKSALSPTSTSTKSVFGKQLRRLHQYGWVQVHNKIQNSESPRFLPGKPRLPVKPEFIVVM